MRQRIGVLAILAGVGVLAVGCTDIIAGTPVVADHVGSLRQDPIPISALDGLLLDVNQLNDILGATSMKVWFNAQSMWDWGQSVTDTNCLAIDGPAQNNVYAGTGWTSVRGQRLDDSIDDSRERTQYAIQAVVAFPSAHDASAFYDSSVQSWSACANRRFFDTSPDQPDTVWTVTGATNDNGTLSVAQTQEGGDGWTCQRALSVRNNISIDIITCSYHLLGSPAIDIAAQIATKIAKQ